MDWHFSEGILAFYQNTTITPDFGKVTPNVECFVTAELFSRSGKTGNAAFQ
ncbi:MAG: hypothetical protein Kow00127_24810 [Bacteroidales bacterium]